MAPGTTTALGSAPPLAVKRNCEACDGTGTGREATVADLRAYLESPFPDASEIFALAKWAASTTPRPKAKDSEKTREEVRHGMFGRKRRMENVTREVPRDYWVLAEKKGYRKQTGDRCERGASQEEEMSFQKRWCLRGDGTLQVIGRGQEAALFN